ncbi:MAG: ATP-dependent Clp protease adaptor ClpS [Planctomycetes bacterium]|nr:ATP-dependent Clp protease adaptor ClpS [Planctomycetota bacterium]
MDADQNAAVAAPQVDQKTKEQPAADKPRLLPPHAVVVMNDDFHTFNYVIDVFAKVFGYAPEKSAVLAAQIHKDGRGIVWSGTKELAELKRDQIRSAGPDVYASRNVDWPLGVVIEPLPG